MAFPGKSPVSRGILFISLARTVAGLFYAWAMYRRGRVEDAIMTHATTNALIAAEVLIFGTCGSD